MIRQTVPGQSFGRLEDLVCGFFAGVGDAAFVCAHLAFVDSDAFPGHDEHCKYVRRFENFVNYF